MMSVGGQNPSLCNFFSFHEETPVEFLDETHVERYF